MAVQDVCGKGKNKGEPLHRARNVIVAFRCCVFISIRYKLHVILVHRKSKRVSYISYTVKLLWSFIPFIYIYIFYIYR